MTEPESKLKPPVKQGASFVAEDGKTYYKYQTSDGELITPKPIDLMTEEDVFSLPISMTPPVHQRISQELTVKFKDPEWAGYWFNRNAGIGKSVARAKTLGWMPVHKTDLEWFWPGAEDADGSMVYGDLCLLKIHKAEMMIQKLHWVQEAKQLQSAQHYFNQADMGLRSTNADPSHLSVYLTPQATQEFSGVGPVMRHNTVK